MAATTITYEGANGEGVWTFYFPTVTVTEVVVPSAFGFARMSTRYLYTVRSVLLAESASDLASKIEEAKNVLESVGGTFTWNRDGGDVVSWSTDDDANFGPHPISLTYDKFFGVRSAMIVWQVEVEVSSVDSEIMDLVYSVSHTIDQNKYTTRTVSGTLRLNGAEFTPQSFRSADSYRLTVDNYVCACPPTWDRVGENYQMSTDGLTLAFNIIDQQRLAVLPHNITSGEAVLSITGNPRSGAKRDFSLAGFFESPPDSPTAPQEAFASLAASLFNFQTANEAFRVKELTFHHNIYRNNLAFHMIWDAFVPDPLTPIPGGTDTEKRSNWMLGLMTRADDWLETYKVQLATVRGPYGTTNVRGWCGSGEVAPVVEPADYQTLHQKTDGGGTSMSGSSSDAAYVTNGENKYFYEWSETFAFHTDHGLAEVVVDADDKDDVMQQVRKPRVYVKVCGKMVTQKDWGTIPEPPYKKEDAWLLDSKVRTEEVKDGPEYTTYYEYLLRLRSHALPTKLKFPFSPFVDAAEFDDTATSTVWPSKTFDNYAFTNDGLGTKPTD